MKEHEGYPMDTTIIKYDGERRTVAAHDDDILREAIRLITGHKAEEIQVETGDEPQVSYQSEDGEWFVMMVYNLEAEYDTEYEERRKKASLKEFWEANLG